MEKNTFISVDITYFDDSPHLTSGYICTHVDSCNLEMDVHVSIEEAEKALAELERRLNQKAECSVNPYNETIHYKRLYGYVD